MNVSISQGNSKLGEIKSVSLPRSKTCRHDCGCFGSDYCYVAKLERLYPSVNKAYQRNYEIYMNDPETYWREVEASIMMSRFFRFHVSGDIVDDAYFSKIVEIAKRNKHCEILIFTKKFDIVNRYTKEALLRDPSGTFGDIPPNLHILFSAWDGLEMDNPYEFPEAHVRYRDGHTTASEGALDCGGNCTHCAITDGGCWALGRGQQVVINQH